MAAQRTRIIAVAGGGAGNAGSKEEELAYQVGFLLARKGCHLLCGGLGGVMERACEGAKAGGALTIGILPGRRPEEANFFVDIPLPTGLGEGRNLLVASMGEGLIAVGGRLGTLSEISFALKQGKPVALLGHWEESFFFELGGSCKKALSPEEAVEWILERVERKN
ncbi:MAG: TIGR00725 family protein [Planctomycetota bacterium]|nr:MAG: TIGR00725 family protein [Planctomycetota bacterium]